ncbi:MAG: AI-2E family transporter [Holosporales bacterium]|jgi:predicted PurR-regulated permease PerM|nr:AI-2E family transporter [Holosporales bacterium]
MKTVWIAVVLAIALVLLYAMGKWVVPFLVSLILAYALHVPTRYLSKSLNIPFSAASGIVVVILIAFLGLFFIFFIPVLKNSTIIIVQKLPILLRSLPNPVNSFLSGALAMVGVDRQFDIETSLQNYISEVTAAWPSYVVHIIDTSMAMFHSLIFIIMIPIIVFHLLRDWDRITSSIQSILKKIASQAVITALSRINTNLGAYVRGQLSVCCILTVVYSTGLFFLGLDEYVICGILSGFLSFAPFFGPVIGFSTTLVMAIDNFSSIHQYILMCCLYTVIPLLDSNIVTPKLIGKSVGIQPVWLLFSICAAISVLGAAGIFISIPVAVILSTVCKELVKKV